MNASNHRLLEKILAGLMKTYSERVPDVGRVVDLLVSQRIINSPNDIENDHIAFRSLGVDHLGIQSLERVFLHCGYERRDAYSFDTKKLDAYWYSPPDDSFPRIFISELRVSDLSPTAQGIIQSYVQEVQSDPTLNLDLDDANRVVDFLHNSLWSIPSWQDYQQLQAESEYAAWVIYNRYYLNHFTISVHNLPAPYHTVASLNDLLEANGIRLNDAGGKIKTSPDGLLVQSSTVAQSTAAQFRCEDGSTEEHQIPGSYVEFAQRKVLPKFASLPPKAIRRQHRREGFEASNADKIFESTFTSQVDRRP